MTTTSTGQELKEQGMTLAEANANSWWKTLFLMQCAVHKNTGIPFTSEDIIRWIGEPPSGSVNAIGSVMNKAVRLFRLERCGYVRAKHPKAHARMLAQWKRKG